MLISTKDNVAWKAFIADFDEEDIRIMEIDHLNIDAFLEANIMDLYLVAEEGRNIGFYGLVVCHGLGLSNTMQTPMYVSKGYRGRGYGKRIVLLAEEKAIDCGMEFTMHRIAHDNKKMIQLSEACGYTECLRDEDYIVFMKDIGV